jgi:hypothetical protein
MLRPYGAKKYITKPLTPKQPMKRFLLLLPFLCSSLFAEDLPVRWLEAGKLDSLGVFDPLLQTQDWTLRFEHRILAQGKATEIRSRFHPPGSYQAEIKTPPLKPGITLKAQLLFGNKPYYDVIIASPDPFEDRKEWFAKHPIALYDPEKTTAEILEAYEIQFKQLRSFADIEAVKDAVIVFGQGVDFEKEKGLAELLFKKAADGGSILVAAPKGNVPLDIPLEYYPMIYSLMLSAKPKHLFPFAFNRHDVPGIRWALKAKDDQLILADNDAIGPHRAKVLGFGPSTLDVRFINKSLGPDMEIQPHGRIVFDKNLQFFFEDFRLFGIESRYYFKSLIETLSND